MEQNQNRNFYRHIFNLIFLLTHHLPFSKSFPEIASKPRKSFDTWYYIVMCATFCVCFHQNHNVFPKYILESKARDQVINQFKTKEEIALSRDSKEWLVQSFVLFLIKIGSTWRREIKEQTPKLTLLYRDRTIKRSHQRCSIKKAVLKNFTIFTGKHMCWDLLVKNKGF